MYTSKDKLDAVVLVYESQYRIVAGRWDSQAYEALKRVQRVIEYIRSLPCVMSADGSPLY